MLLTNNFLIKIEHTIIPQLLVILTLLCNGMGFFGNIFPWNICYPMPTPATFPAMLQKAALSSETIVSNIIYFTGREASDCGSKNYIGKHLSVSNKGSHHC